MEQFARQEGINRLTQAKWAHLQGRQGKAAAVQFAEVKLGAAGPVRWAFELALPNGFVVRAAAPPRPSRNCWPWCGADHPQRPGRAHAGQLETGVGSSRES
jgi:hypothetical protein